MNLEQNTDEDDDDDDDDRGAKNECVYLLMFALGFCVCEFLKISFVI